MQKNTKKYPPHCAHRRSSPLPSLRKSATMLQTQIIIRGQDCAMETEDLQRQREAAEERRRKAEEEYQAVLRSNEKIMHRIMLGAIIIIWGCLAIIFWNAIS